LDVNRQSLEANTMTSPLVLTLLLLLGVSLVLSLALTPVIRALARRCGLVDRPDQRRKIHGRPIPVAGGVAIVVASVTAVGLALLSDNPLRPYLADQADGLTGLLLGALVICAVGVADDYHCLRGRHKLLGQAAAVALVIHFGVLVRTVHLFNCEIELGLLAVPFTAFWLLGAINALNLIDGMDGLLSSVGLIVTLAMSALAGIHGQWAAACVAIVLAGALLGFLRYNFPPASIFLGDCGSMVVGLAVGVLAIQSSLKGPAAVALAAPTALLTIPIFDTTAAIIRRKLTGRSLYSTDRGHLHHCLLRSGLSNRRVLLLVAALCLVTVVGTLASLAWKADLFALLSALVVVAALVLTRLFGHAELVLLGQRCAALARSLLAAPADRAACQVEVHLQGSADWRALWARLTACASELELHSVRLDVNAPAIHEGYHARWDCQADVASDGLWRAEIPLTAWGHPVGRLEVAGPHDRGIVWAKIATMATLVEEIENTVTRLTAAGTTAPLAAPAEVQTV
jgi:UDP-GlcNAc:undecaprenyl-phosphate GlcNAc-1-phosphate transferase